MAILDTLEGLSSVQLISGFIGILIAYSIYLRLYINALVRKSGGVRAPIIASNLFTALGIFWRVSKAQSRHRLLRAFNDLFVNNPPGTLQCVEFTVGIHKRRFFITKEPEQIKAVLTTQFADYGKGRIFHDAWSPFLGDSIFTTDGQQWHDSRSLIRPMFIKDRVSDLAIFQRWTDLLISKLPPSGGTVDIMDLFYRMTLDVATDFLLGVSVNSLTNPKHHFAHAFNEVQRVQMLLTILGPISFVVPRSSYNHGIKAIEEFISPFIEQALALPSTELEELSRSDKQFTFLHNIARFTRDPKVIRDQIVAVLLAGRDTTAATLSWAVLELGCHPPAYARLRAEVLARVGPARAPTYEDLKAMPYLTHAVAETLRLYPAVPYNVRTALADTTLPGLPGEPDIALSRDDSVVYSTLAMQRRRELYPETSPGFADPAEFSPERWEMWTPKPWQYVPFNGGPRICIGQNFAMTEIAFVLVRLCQKYERMEYRGVDQGGDLEDVVMKSEIVGPPAYPVEVALYEASQS